MRKDPTHPHSIRFPTDLYRQIKDLAEEERRSFNAQVIFLLEESIRRIQEDKPIET